MSILNKILGKGALDFVGKASEIADKFIQTKEEKAAFEMEMKKVVIEAEAEIQKQVSDLQPRLVVVEYIDLVETPPHIRGE